MLVGVRVKLPMVRAAPCSVGLASIGVESAGAFKPQSAVESKAVRVGLTGLFVLSFLLVLSGLMGWFGGLFPAVWLFGFDLVVVSLALPGVVRVRVKRSPPGVPYWKATGAL